LRRGGSVGGVERRLVGGVGRVSGVKGVGGVVERSAVVPSAGSGSEVAPVVHAGSAPVSASSAQSPQVASSSAADGVPASSAQSPQVASSAAPQPVAASAVSSSVASAPGVEHAAVVSGSSAPGVEHAAVVSGSGSGGGVVGSVSSGVAGVLASPGLSAGAGVRAWLASGGVDPRVVSVLGSVLAHHSVGVANVQVLSSPVHVQSLDIVSVDGQPVGADNFAARDVVTELAALGVGVRPDEIGTPWPIQSPGFFSDGGSVACVHLAFEMPGTGSAMAPVGAAAGVGGASGQPVMDYAVGAQPVASAAAGPSYGVVGGGQFPAVAPAGSPLAAATPVGSGAAQAPVQPGLGSGVGASGGLSANPADAAKLDAMVRRADSMLGKPYILGGGHAGWGPSAGYDCSGFVSAVLHAGGYLNQPVVTTNLPEQAGILSGPGRLVTIFDRALPGENGHVIVCINGQFYESGGMHGPWGGGGGVEKIGRPSAAYLATFPNILHPEGM
jgi:cell wall-associated NlpC family hydrolase